MKRSEYLSDKNVRAFINWAANLVSGEWGLVHSYTNGKGKKFACASLYDAYEDYNWPSKVKFANGSTIRTKTFDQTAELFDEFRSELKEATDANPATDRDKDSFLNTADHVAKWGGIYNLKSLPDMGRDALKILKANARRLDPKNADTDDLGNVTHMGAGYSKIYSAMIKDFPIYDSRVACALTSLIWLFCRENRLAEVPEPLALGVPKGQDGVAVLMKWLMKNPERQTWNINRLRNPRNPSDDPYEFSNIEGISKKQLYKYADSNLKAAWILGELAEIGEGDFSKVPKKRRVRALEAALFMTGYEPLSEHAVRKS